MLDAPEAGADGRRERDVGIDVGGRDPVLDALARRTAADHAQRRRAVLDSPGRRGRRPVARHQARVAVHGAGDHREQLRHQRLLAADEPAHGIRHVVRLRGIVEYARRRRLCASRGAGGRSGRERLLDHLAMKVAIRPWRCASTFVKVLNSAARSAASRASQYVERGLEHAGSGLGVQSLDREAHGLAEIEQLVIQRRMHGTAQHRIAESAGRHGLELPIALVAHRLRASRRTGRTRTPRRRSPCSPCPRRARARAAACRAGRPLRRGRRIRRETARSSARTGCRGRWRAGRAPSHPGRRCASR